MTGIYVIRVGADRLKVGKSVDVVKRAAQIRAATGLPVEFIGFSPCLEGNLAANESAALNLMVPFRIRGEWHHYSRESVNAALAFAPPFKCHMPSGNGPGAPKKPNSRRQVLHVRMTADEIELVKHLAERRCKSMSEFARERMLAS